MNLLVPVVVLGMSSTNICFLVSFDHFIYMLMLVSLEMLIPNEK
jgi:hypothetical protein